jgi:hypothetical protein
VGTDDGNIQLTRDGGSTWKRASPGLKGVPKGEAWVSWVEASRHASATAFVTVDRHTWGDMEPHAYRTDDYGRSWQRIAGPGQGVRGYAHVIRQDSVNPDLLFLGTELGLWISVDAGANWAEFKGGNFPSVAVRDVQLQERDRDLVIATHGRGIWIVDDITPLRALDASTLDAEAAFLPGRPVQQRISGVGGWTSGDAVFVGQDAPAGAVITYYQRTRHIFGGIRLDILDAEGKIVDTLPAAKRRGINRVNWTMRVKPPRVPRAAQVAFAGTQGPRVLPGTYTVRLTKGKQVYETPLVVGLDRRADYSVEDRKAQYEASMRVHALFGRMTDLTDRIVYLSEAAGAAAEALEAKDALRTDLEALAADAAALRTRIVATKEGGAITGEERLREFTDQLYSALLSYEGRPAQTLLDRSTVLEEDLAALTAEFDALAASRVPALNARLGERKRTQMAWPPAPAAAEAAALSGGVAGGTSGPERFARNPLWHVRLR